MMAPSFFKPASITELVHWSSLVSQAAPLLPFFYYHIPSMTGLNFNMPEFFAAAQDEIPMLTGIKFTGILFTEIYILCVCVCVCARQMREIVKDESKAVNRLNI